MANKNIYSILTITLVFFSLFLLTPLVLGLNDTKIPQEPYQPYTPPTINIITDIIWPLIIFWSLSIIGTLIIIFLIGLPRKNLSSWLKGGIYGLIFFVVNSILLFTPILGSDWRYGYQMFVLPFTFTIYIVGGIILGWIIGKFKKK